MKRALTACPQETPIRPLARLQSHTPTPLALAAWADGTAAGLLTSAATVTSLTAELKARCDDSCSYVGTLSRSVRASLLECKNRALRCVKQLSRKQCKVAVADSEAADVSTEQLRVWAAVAQAVALSVSSTPNLLCAFTASPLLVSPPLAQGYAFALWTHPFAVELGSLATGDGLRVVSAGGPGLKWFEPHSRNEFSVVLAQADVPAVVGDSPTGVVAESVAAVTAVRSDFQGNDLTGPLALRAGYKVACDADAEVHLQLAVCGVVVVDTPGTGEWGVRVLKRAVATHECAAAGVYVRTLAVVPGYLGMAVSPDGKWLVVGLEYEGTLSVYSLPGGELVRTFGGQGDGMLEFDYQCGLCFAQDDHLLAADTGNKRLQEVTLEGVFVRFIGVGEFGDGHPACIAVHDDVIAVGCDQGTGLRVLLFDFATGTVTSRFGEMGTAPGELSTSCDCIQFTPDGSHLVVAERDAERLSLFSVAGVFVKCIGVGVLGYGESSALFSETGEFVVADYGNDRVCVFSRDGSELVRSWGVKGLGDGQFDRPAVLAAAGKYLYVMDWVKGEITHSTRVQVFE